MKRLNRNARGRYVTDDTWTRDALLTLIDIVRRDHIDRAGARIVDPLGPITGEEERIEELTLLREQVEGIDAPRGQADELSGLKRTES